jgi:Leucine-rich repeat (LRR) protein
MDINLGGAGLSAGELSEELDRVRKKSDVSSLLLSKNVLSALTSKFFDNLKTLTVLELSTCALTDVSCLSQLVTLETLNLQWNVLTTVAPLSRLTKLRRLNLTGNNLALFDLRELRKLEVLHLSNNRLTRLGFFDKPSLHTLSLTRNELLPARIKMNAILSLEECAALQKAINEVWCIDLEMIVFLFCWKTARLGEDESVLRGVPKDMARFIAEKILQRKNQ